MSKFPFFTMQQLNLDWLMKKMQKILAFLPVDSGTAGQILQRGSQSARWVNIGAVSMDIHGLQTTETVTGSDELPVYNTSVEGNRKMTISALAAMLPSPTAPVTSVNGKTGAVTVHEVIGAAAAFAIPASGASVSYDLDGITSDHELVRWNFSSSAENQPPVDLYWESFDGYFTITNTNGTTSESIRPVFVLPTKTAATTH